MADLNITGDVKPGKDAKTTLVQVGEAVTAGQLGYQNTGDNKYYKAINTGKATAAVKGVFLTPASADEYAVLQTGGSVTIGATVAKGDVFVCSATAGGIAFDSDLIANAWITNLGRGESTTAIQISIDQTGIQHA